MKRVVIDTNVLVSGLRSRKGASFRILSLLGKERFEPVLSVPLVLEYEEVLLRPGMVPLSREDVGTVLDYLCSVSYHQPVHFLWRPLLPDPGDDLLLELAVAANCSSIITFNIRDFRGVERFGIRAMLPQEFLRHIDEVS